MTNVAGQVHEDEKPLNCPKCAAAMEKVTFQNITVDRCTACRGLWFDALEQEHLAAIKGSEAIDVGARPAGAGGQGRRRATHAKVSARCATRR